MIALYKYPEQGVKEISARNKETPHGKVLLPSWKLPTPSSGGEAIQAWRWGSRDGEGAEKAPERVKNPQDKA